MVRRFWAVFAVVGLLASNGCGFKTRVSEEVGVAHGIAGAWKVDAPDLVPGTVLLLTNDLHWDTPCGMWFGSWRADSDGAFAAIVDGWEGDDCQPPHDGDSTPKWLRGAARYQLDSSGAALLDVEGQVVAQLSPADAPSSSPSLDPVRVGLRASEPLPSGVVAADRDTLVGRWGPIESSDHPEPPYLEVLPDGSWSASDGCNASVGRWALGEQGSLAAVSGPTTEVGCNNVAIGVAFAQATRVGLDGTALVMFDASGKELLRLTHDG